MISKAAALALLILQPFQDVTSGRDYLHLKEEAYLNRKRIATPLVQTEKHQVEYATQVHTSRVLLVPTGGFADADSVHFLHRDEPIPVPLQGLREDIAPIAFFPSDPVSSEPHGSLQIRCPHEAPIIGEGDLLMPLRLAESTPEAAGTPLAFTLPESCSNPKSLHFESGSEMGAGTFVLAYSQTSPALNLQLTSRDLVAGRHQDISFDVWFSGLDTSETVSVSFEARLELEIEQDIDAKVKNETMYPTYVAHNDYSGEEILLKVPIYGQGLHRITVTATADDNTLGKVVRTLQVSVPVLGQKCLPAVSNNSPILIPPSTDSPDFWDVLIPFNTAITMMNGCAKDSEDVQVSAELWTSPGQALVQLSTISTRAVLDIHHHSFLGSHGLHSDESYYLLSFHNEWLHTVDSPFPSIELRNIQLRDRHMHIVFSKVQGPTQFRNSADWMSSAIMEETRRNLRGHSPAMATFPKLKKAMLHGPVPKGFQSLMALQTEDDQTAAQLVLTHGYCAHNAPFPKADFPEDSLHYTAGYDEALSNDEMARELLSFLAQKQAKKYSIIGHSQGGMAALHIYTYYWSGLDLVTQTGEEVYLIQTLSSPFQGTPLMESWILNDIAALLGFFCGYTSDLSKDGAAAWLQGIPEDRRKQLMYYTIWNGESQVPCIYAAELFFDSIDDGATEVRYNILEGSAGPAVEDPKFSWCHSTGMKHDPGYYDHARNTAMVSSAPQF